MNYLFDYEDDINAYEDSIYDESYDDFDNFVDDLYEEGFDDYEDDSFYDIYDESYDELDDYDDMYLEAGSQSPSIFSRIAQKIVDIIGRFKLNIAKIINDINVKIFNAQVKSDIKKMGKILQSRPDIGSLKVHNAPDSKHIHKLVTKWLAILVKESSSIKVWHPLKNVDFHDKMSKLRASFEKDLDIAKTKTLNTAVIDVNNLYHNLCNDSSIIVNNVSEIESKLSSSLTKVSELYNKAFLKKVTSSYGQTVNNAAPMVVNTIISIAIKLVNASIAITRKELSATMSFTKRANRHAAVNEAKSKVSRTYDRHKAERKASAADRRNWRRTKAAMAYNAKAQGRNVNL